MSGSTDYHVWLYEEAGGWTPQLSGARGQPNLDELAYRTGVENVWIARGLRLEPTKRGFRGIRGNVRDYPLQHFSSAEAVFEMHRLLRDPSLDQFMNVIASGSGAAGQWAPILEQTRQLPLMSRAMKAAGRVGWAIPLVYSAGRAFTGPPDPRETRDALATAAWSLPYVRWLTGPMASWVGPAIRRSMIDELTGMDTMTVAKVQGSILNTLTNMQRADMMNASDLASWGSSPFAQNQTVTSIPDWVLLSWRSRTKPTKAFWHFGDISFDVSYASNRLRMLQSQRRFALQLEARLLAANQGNAGNRTWAMIVAKIDRLGAMGYTRSGRALAATVLAASITDLLLKNGPVLMRPRREELAGTLRSYILWACGDRRLPPLKGSRRQVVQYLVAADVLPRRVLSKVRHTSDRVSPQEARRRALLIARKSGHLSVASSTGSRSGHSPSSHLGEQWGGTGASGKVASVNGGNDTNYAQEATRVPGMRGMLM